MVSSISSSECWVRICLASQRLDMLLGQTVQATYPISSGANGIGEMYGSGCTPRGWHMIRAKIGAGSPLNTVFVGRRPTGEIYEPALAAKHPERDWMLTRLLWLSGLERGMNRLGNVDTMRRYIYIHGTPDSTPLGKPGSKGCIRMHNHDLLSIFDTVSAGTKVLLTESLEKYVILSERG